MSNDDRHEKNGDAGNGSARSFASAPTPGPFRIQAVSELTGVAETTLRAWERRYGIPSPERTATGYRLYTQHQVDQVREMLRLCEEEGLAPAEAARTLQSKTRAQRVQEAEPSEPAAASPAVPRATARALASEDEPMPMSRPGIDVWESAIESIVSAADQFDDLALDEALRRLVMLGSANLVVDNVITPALRIVGEKWHQGELTVAQEHMVSHRINSFLRGLLQLSNQQEDGPRAVLASFADDDHEIGLLAIALRLHGWGFRTIFLGARTPPGAIRHSTEALAPKLVCLSVTITPERGRARELVDDYAVACGNVPWIVGGAGASPIADLIQSRGGHIVPESRTELRSLLKQLLAEDVRR
jgi:DNA-binding transcriptional MerR regulator/methylmalonyl-CoA mutase cobalamin-binding subunit